MKQKMNNRSSKVFWPKRVVKKWLNLKSGVLDFQSDYSSKAFEGKKERRKSCSDKDSYVYTPREFSGGLMESKMGSSASKDNLDLRVMVGTWNVGGKPPHKELDLRDWLTDSAQPDIYVLGFQEIVPLNPSNVLGAEDNGPAAKWLDLIRQSLNNPNTKQNNPNVHCNYENAIIDNDLPDQERLLGQRQGIPHKPNLSLSDLISLDGKLLNSEMNCLEKPRSISERLNPVSVSHCTPSLKQNGNASLKKHKYCLVASKQMVGIFSCVWVRADLCTHINNVRVFCVGTGIMGYLGNKGSVSISMTLYDTTFCFVCTHLTSGEKEGNEIKRNSDVTEILKRTRFSGPCRSSISQALSPESILEHDKIIWLGDLNYRLASTWEETLKLLMENDWESLLEKDQLRIEQKAGRVFEGWEEGRINFAPTYKFIPNSDNYAAMQHFKSKQTRRAPAWCDRILWKGEGMKQAFYSKGESKFSDHRSVTSLFLVPIRMPLAPPVVTGVRLATNLSSLAYNAKVQVEELLI